MSYQNSAGYAGDLLAIDAYAAARRQSTSVLIDVRTQAEWALRRAPDHSSARQDAIFRGMAELSFDGRSDAELRRAPVEARSRPRASSAALRSLFLCRSGARSRHAAIAMTAARAGRLLQCLGRIRGPAWTLQRRRSAVGGWKAGDCPGRRRKRPRPFEAPRRRLSFHPIRQSYAMDILDEIRRRFRRWRTPSERAAARRSLAALLRSAASGTRRRRLQQLVRAASTSKSVGSGQARLSVPTRFLKSWIVTHYSGHVAAALDAEFGPVARILIVRSSVAARAQPAARRDLRRCRRPRGPRRCEPPDRDRSAPPPASLGAHPAHRAVGDASGRLAPRSPADLLDLPGRAVERARL